ncbi:MAG: class I SAM-dependent methyltransferase [Deltaproteobacteria bacterium]|nr:class I SAM-dependent methyltransferase [Deltaproteobacteria bacterium]
MTDHATTPRSYRDYFIVNGRHVGDYEGMYRDCEDPWNIESLGLRLDMLAALLLAGHSPPEARGPGGALRVLDAGAGAGLFSLALYEELTKGFLHVELTLADISPTALRKARARFEAAGAALPRLVPYDLRLLAGGPAGGVCHGPGGVPVPNPEPSASARSSAAASFSSSASTRPVPGQDAAMGPRETGPSQAAEPGRTPSPSGGPFTPGSFDLIVLAQTLWGIVLELPGVTAGFRHLLAERGQLLVSQHFPGKDVQEWGREVTGPEAFSTILAEGGFEPLSELETNRASNHHWGAMWRKI